MVLMTDGKTKKYVADVLINFERRNGFKVVGEPDVVPEETPNDVAPLEEETPKKFKCPYCDKEYASEATLARHIKEKHSEETTTSEE